MIDFKSDSLSQLRPFFESLDDLEVLGTIHQFPIIVDSCVVLSDLIWLTKHRKKNGARTSLLECVHAGTLILYAPYELEKEVSSKFQRISVDEDISLQALENAWLDYKKWIHLIEVDSPTESEIEAAQDPKDLPFKLLQEKTSYPIYTNDTDINAMGGKVIQREAIDQSRDYSRSAAVEFSLKVMGLFSVLSVFALIKFLLVGIRSSINLIRQAPVWLQLGGLLILIIFLTNKNSNQQIRVTSKKGASRIKKFSFQFLEFIDPLIDKFNESQQKANTSLDLIKQKIM